MPGAPSSAVAKAAAAKAQAEAEAQAQQLAQREALDRAQAEAEAKAAQRAQMSPGDLHSASCYPNEAAEYFGENFAHRLRWAHAVNNLRALRHALRSTAHFLEADVSAGTLTEEKMDPAVSNESPKGNAKVVETSVATSSNIPIIMAHYPTQRSSDLCFELFVAAVLKHNAQVEGDGLDVLENGEDAPLAALADGAPDAAPDATPPEEAPEVGRPQRSPFSEPVLHQEQEEPLVRSASAIEARQSLHGQEAAAFAVDLHRELEASNQNQVMMACIGARRGSGAGMRTRNSSKKGVKLDFKVLECVEPALRHLHSVGAAQKLGGHLWLNADVFAGPGYPERFLSPIDARNFVQLCAELVPEAVLSLSWGSSSLSASRCYTADMVNRMIELCMSPIVPRPIRQPASAAHNSRAATSTLEDSGCPAEARPSIGGDKDIYLTPAASCQHITFAVAAEYALNSSENLLKLLNAVPGSSLTIFSGVGSLGIPPRTIQDIITTYGTTRCFLDLRVTKPCRTCSQGGVCSMQ